jgi:hypothetical protein
MSLLALVLSNVTGTTDQIEQSANCVNFGRLKALVWHPEGPVNYPRHGNRLPTTNLEWGAPA